MVLYGDVCTEVGDPWNPIKYVWRFRLSTEPRTNHSRLNGRSSRAVPGRGWFPLSRCVAHHISALERLSFTLLSVSGSQIACGRFSPGHLAPLAATNAQFFHLLAVLTLGTSSFRRQKMQRMCVCVCACVQVVQYTKCTLACCLGVKQKRSMTRVDKYTLCTSLLADTHSWCVHSYSTYVFLTEAPPLYHPIPPWPTHHHQITHK